MDGPGAVDGSRDVQRSKFVNRAARIAAAGALGAAALALGTAGPAAAAPVELFSSSEAGAHTGAATVPAGICRVTVIADGARGGDGFDPDSANGGAGAEVTALIPVTPGAVLDVIVGGAGTDGTATTGGNGGVGGGGGGGEAKGYNGTHSGGGGGGASAVTTGTEPLVVAGGGGGGSVAPGVRRQRRSGRPRGERRRGARGQRRRWRRPSRRDRWLVREQ